MAGKKRYPVQRMINLTSVLPAPANLIADVGMLMSQTNHRLYRQSRYYEVKVDLDTDLADGTTVDVYALADSWMVQNALKMAKAAWDAANEEEKDFLKGKLARWNDFRTNASVGGAGSVQSTNFLKATLAATPFTAGEFNYSNVVDQTGATRFFSWGGPTASNYSIIEEYDASGNTSSDPTTPAGGPYNNLLPGLDAGAADALQEDGNLPPYDADDIGQNIWVKVGTIHLGAGRQRTSTGFFTAPCGFVVLAGAGTIIADNATNISIECKRGDYKGIHAPTMLE